MSAGQRFAVRKSEFGKRTNTTSPRPVFIVNVRFRSIPIFGERAQPATEIARLGLADSTGSQIYGAIIRCRFFQPIEFSGLFICPLFTCVDIFLVRGKLAQLAEHSSTVSFAQLGEFLNNFGCAHGKIIAPVDNLSGEGSRKQRKVRTKKRAKALMVDVRHDEWSRSPRTPCCGIGFLGDSKRSRSTKEESQPPVRAKVGAHVGAVEKSVSIMNADLVKAASEVITNPQILVNMISRRVRQLSLGHRPLVEHAPGLREADIALTEIANGKLTFESTFGQNGTDEVPARVVLFPDVIVAKKTVGKKKAA
jgi:DNA-directed RNA polymerase subunit omega